MSCGILMNNNHNIRCWGNHKQIKKYFPSNIINGPYKQVSVGSDGLCVIKADISNNKLQNEVINNENLSSNSLKCWSYHGIHIIPGEWDQVTVGEGAICGVTMNSELKCWNTHSMGIVNEFYDISKDIIVA